MKTRMRDADGKIRKTILETLDALDRAPGERLPEVRRYLEAALETAKASVATEMAARRSDWGAREDARPAEGAVR